MELLRYQWPGRQLLSRVDVRGQETVGVHVSVWLPVQCGGGPVVLSHSSKIQEEVDGVSTSQQSLPQLCSDLWNIAGIHPHLYSRKLRGEYLESCFNCLSNNSSSQGLQLAPLWSVVWLLPGMAFSIVLVSYEELRKAISRKHPGAWVDRETHY